MLRPGSFALTALLAFLSAFGPLSVDLFLPSLPEISRVFAAPATQVHLTISLYFIGFAVGQIIYGPISDRLGRKSVIVGAFSLYCIASAFCLVAPTIEALVVCRIGQALGASGSIVVVRAVVRDMYEGPSAGRQLSLMGMIMGIMPIIAPIIGGLLLTLFHWRAGFVFQLCVGATAGYLVWRYLPETRKEGAVRHPVSLASYRMIATHPVFVTNLVVGVTGYSGLFAWIGGSSFVMQGLVGLTALQYSIVYGVSCIGYIIGATIAARLVMRIGLDKTAGLGALLLAVAGCGMMAGVGYGHALPITLTLAMNVFLCGLGLLLSQTVAAALTPFPHHAGIASSLIGFVQQCSAALMGTIVGNTLGATAWPMAIGTLVAGGGSLALWVLTRPVRTGARAPDR